MVEPYDRLPPGVDLGVLGKTLIEAAGAARIGVCVALLQDGRAHNVFVSEAAASILGWPIETLLGEDSLSHIAPEHLDFVRSRHARRLAGEEGQASYELNFLRRDGTRVPVAITATRVLLGERPAIVVFIFDLTERRAADLRRQEAEARFRQLIEKAPEPIGIFDRQFFIYANPAFVTALGYSTPDELYPVPLADLVAAEDVDRLEARVHLIIDHGSPLPAYVYRVRRRDGSMLLLEMSSVPYEFEGKPAILAMGRDVTERRLLEARLVQTERLAALGTLAAGIAHEINNPLAYVMLNLDWIARQLAAGTPPPESMEGLVEMLQEARGGTERVATIVRELRSFSRADEDTRRGVDLASVVRSAIKIAAHEIRPKARVTTSIEPLAPVWANEGRLEQVVLNLLLNAAQALPEMRPNNEIRVVVRPDASGDAVLEVSDNGVGIPPEVLPRIFDPFFTTKAPGLGTGLGLSICHGIVSSLGGHISVHSVPGEGTTFRAVLPTARPEGPEPPPNARPAAPARPLETRARVLVVDDEPQIAATLRELLTSEHDVVAVTSAFDALGLLLGSEEFDVVFCDLIMPGMSGMDLFKALARERPGTEKRIVFMTGGAFAASTAEFLASVDNRRLEKPFSLVAIERIVREMKARREGAA